MKTSEVVVRMPPSPTGSLHLGTARTALFNFLFARHFKGKILFRWEDTDRERSKKEFEKEILQGLKWLGMDFEKEAAHMFRQTENEKTHHAWLETLWKNEKIFPCFVSSEEIASQRENANKKHANFVFWSPWREGKRSELEKKMKQGESFVWRLRVPKEEKIIFDDLIRGCIEVNSATLGDFAIARADGSVLYPLANVIDDWTQGVTHVLRGEDHISNTPKQILIYHALGADEPYFGHIPLVLDDKKRKLSKRNVSPDTCVLIKDFQAAGFVPEAVVNGLALLGWNPKSEQEIFSFAELIQQFDLKKVNPGAAQYNFEKMKWINTQWIRALPVAKLMSHFNAFSETNFGTKQAKIFEYVREKVRNLEEMKAHLEYLNADPGINGELLPNEKMNLDLAQAKKMLAEAESLFESLKAKEWNRDTIQEKIVQRVQELGVTNGHFFHPLRIALSNRAVSVGPCEIAAILGKTETLRRVKRAQ